MKNVSFASAQLLADAISNLQKHNVSIILSYDKKVRSSDGKYCKGYWEDDDKDNPVFACSIRGSPESWIGVFAHEYCHFLQWLDKDIIWKRYHDLDGDILCDCIDNKPVKAKDLDYYMDTVRDIEWDCEKRTVKLLKKYGIPLNIDDYIRAANIYIFYYTYLKTSRKWTDEKKKALYEFPEVRNLVKTSFYRSYTKIPSDLLKAFIKYEPPVKKNKIIEE